MSTTALLPPRRAQLGRLSGLAVPGRRAELALVAVLAVGAIAVGGARPLTLGLLWLAVVTPRLIAIDIAEHRLPDAIVLRGYPVALAAVTLDAVVTGGDLNAAVTAALAYGGVLFVLHLIGGMGFGDVKLAPILGLLLGALSPAAAIVGPMLAAFIGGVIATAAMIRRGPDAHIPFGPPMLLGAWAALLLAA